MRTKITRRKGSISLVIDHGRKKDSEYDILASMTLLEGTGCWRLEDVRLHQYANPSSFFGQKADDYCAQYIPKDADEAEFVKSLLREHQEYEGKILWCTFEGIVRGHPEINGYKPVRWAGFDQAGYFSLAEGLEKLCEIKSFWDAFKGDPKSVKTDNPNRQLTETELTFMVFMRNKGLIEGSKQEEDGVMRL
jgi:hypothetical protein